MSVGDIARAWDICACAAICEYTEQEEGALAQNMGLGRSFELPTLYLF